MKNKVPLFERIDKLLQNDKQSIKLIVCRSALDELNTLPGDIMKEARQFGLVSSTVLVSNRIRLGLGVLLLLFTFLNYIRILG